MWAIGSLISTLWGAFSMKPFDSYPGDRIELLPRSGGANARREYGLKLQRLTGQSSYAYCGVSLVDDYYHWILLNVDHVYTR